MTNTDHIQVSVIVPCYNYGRFLKECLNSLIAQTYRNWECIIIDNGSTDITKEVALSFSAKDGRFRYEYTEQKGVSFARNYGIKVSRGTYLFPLDADDRIAATYLEKAVSIIENNSSVKVVYSDAELFGASSGKWTLPAYSFKKLLIENTIFCTALFRKSDAEKIKGFNEEMREGFEDWDFWIRMLKDGGNVYKIPEVLFYYRIRADSRNSVLDKEKQLLLRKRIFENHRTAYEETFQWPEFIFEYYMLTKEINALKASRDLKTGKVMLAPFRFMKKLFNR